ncbi:MAG TPA: ferritin-like domain-containing protein, partial [Acidimicrobiia bacterium]
GVDPEAVYRTMDRVNPPAQQQFQQLLFSKIVPNCKKLGLLDAADGWLRARFAEIGVIQFEDWADTGEEYAALDEVAKDRQASAA